MLPDAGKDRTQFEDTYKNLMPLMRNNGYDVARVALSKDDPLPDGLNTLIVMNPAELNQRQLYEIINFSIMEERFHSSPGF